MQPKGQLIKASISIVIPAYNEEENITWVTKDTIKNLPNFFKNYEIIIVDDGSKDQTGILAEKLANSNPRVKVIHQKNGGYSKAMLTGIQAATKEFVAYMPADGQFLVSDMRYCFSLMKNNDLVLGYRGGRFDYTLRRMFLSYGYLMLLAIFFNIKYMDVGWVNIWRTKKVQSLELTCTGGIFILAEIVIKFMKKDYRIIEAPSFYHPRKSGKVKNDRFIVVMKIFLSALGLKWDLILDHL